MPRLRGARFLPVWRPPVAEVAERREEAERALAAEQERRTHAEVETVRLTLGNKLALMMTGFH